MKKLISFTAVILLLVSMLSSCTKNSVIRYSTSQGTKIEKLTRYEQADIDEYVNDCKAIFTHGYADLLESQLRSIQEPYLAFTDTFVYDFRDVDESDMSKQSSMIWKNIKELNPNDAEPIMYIELCGYLKYWSDDYVITSFNETAMLYGFFIFDDDTYAQNTYKRICNINYTFTLVDGAEIINCGDKYSEELDGDQVLDFDEDIERLELQD